MDLKSHWQLNRDVDYLNHGSFGATPPVVLEKQRSYQDLLEQDPIEFLAPERSLEPKLDHVRSVVSRIVGADPQDLALVRTATDGVNAVLRSMTLNQGDEIVITDHGYNACNNAARYVAARAGASVRQASVPFPIRDGRDVVAAIDAALSERTRLLVIDHVTSPTGLVLPVAEIVSVAKSRGIRVLVDGAHAPGMVPVDVARLGADYYTGNHHKWLCAPKVSAFLHVRRELQDEVRPTVISHGFNRCRPGRSQFLSQFDWCGTFDPSPVLAVPAAVKFLDSLLPDGLQGLMKRNQDLALSAQQCLADALGIPLPAPADMIGSMVSVPLPFLGQASDEQAEAFQRQLVRQHRFEAPVFRGPGDSGTLLRVSMQAYNTIDQIERLARVLKTEVGC